MLGRLTRCIIAVGSRWTVFAGAIFTILGAVRAFREVTPFPAWAWWLGAIALMFWTACRIQWDRQKEDDLRLDRSADAKMPMNEAVRYIATRSSWIRDHQHDPDKWFIELQNDFLDALRLGRVVAFGRDGSKSPGGFKTPQRQITPAEWAQIRPEIFDGLFGHNTDNYASPRYGDGTVFHDIFISRDQVHDVWPKLPVWNWFKNKSLMAEYDKRLQDNVR